MVNPVLAEAVLENGTTIAVRDDSIHVTGAEVVSLGGRAHRACIADAGVVALVVEQKVLREADGRMPEHYAVSYETRVFDAATGNIVRLDIPSQHETELLISPDGTTLVTFRPEHAIWALPSGDRVASIEQSDLPFTVAAFDRGAPRFAVLCDGNPNPFAELNDRTPWETDLRVWNRDGTLVFAERGPYHAVDYLGFGDDGRTVVGLDKNRQPAIEWKIDTGERCPALSVPSSVEPSRSVRARRLRS